MHTCIYYTNVDAFGDPDSRRGLARDRRCNTKKNKHEHAIVPWAHLWGLGRGEGGATSRCVRVTGAKKNSRLFPRSWDIFIEIVWCRRSKNKFESKSPSPEGSFNARTMGNFFQICRHNQVACWLFGLTNMQGWEWYVRRWCLLSSKTLNDSSYSELFPPGQYRSELPADVIS